MVQVTPGVVNQLPFGSKWAPRLWAPKPAGNIYTPYTAQQPKESEIRRYRLDLSSIQLIGDLPDSVGIDRRSRCAHDAKPKYPERFHASLSAYENS
ncbi:unnamed protein product [Somion occarium]|uniref:Uncharacterized protein n=1 Tax=Somion occarium TaxID=3059160 RepID=A0ABP1CS59_9APHY